MTKKKKRRKKSLGSHAGEGVVMEEGLCGPVQSQTERKHKSESKPVPNVSGGRTFWSPHAVTTIDPFYQDLDQNYDLTFGTACGRRTESWITNRQEVHSNPAQ